MIRQETLWLQQSTSRLGIVLAAVFLWLVLSIEPARSNSVLDAHDLLDNPLLFHTWPALLPAEQGSVAIAASTVATPRAATFILGNFGATLESGEPTEGGLMTRTIWARYTPKADERVVLHTFGSDVNTVLAVYTGTTIHTLSRVTGNDDYVVPNVSTKHSLVTFDANAGTDYSIQIGSRANAEEDIVLSAYRFPPAGGLSAFLASSLNGRDYTCDWFNNGVPCPEAQFIVHNSSVQTLTVTPSTTLGAGVGAGAPFSLAPNAVRLVTFTFKPRFGRTVRTVAGHFVFTGRLGNTVVSEARTRAIAIVKDSNRPDVMQLEVTPTLRTARVNEAVPFTATLTNTGTSNAIGCHFRSKDFSDLKTVNFFTINPDTGARLSPNRKPVTLAPGESKTFTVEVASRGARDGFYIDPEVIADCANTAPVTRTLLSGFDLSASGYEQRLPYVESQILTPASGVLNVPATAPAFFRVRAISRNTTRLLTAQTSYESPFDDAPDSRFTVAICRLDPATDACLEPYDVRLQYTAVRNVATTFSVRVTAPARAPGFDPEQRRVFLNYKLTEPSFNHVGTTSVAVRKR